MISEEAIDKVIERLGTRIEVGNEKILKKIGESVKKIGTLTPSQARQLGQMLKYGSDFDEITQELENITGRNVSDIYDIYEEVAKNDYNFARQFYDYRNTKYIPYEENYALQNQIMAIASITASEYMNISRTTSLGYGTFDELGNVTYKGVRDVYYDLIDEAILNVAQGKESFDEAMYRQLKTIGESGLRVIYPSTYETTDEFGNPIIKNRSMRLDSAIRMNMKQGLTDMHNETQKQFGQEFGADGVEISVHGNPAPDHAEAQGRQFSNAEFEKLQTTGNAKDYKGKAISIYGTLKSGAPTRSFRPIGMYNCYHYNFSIVLGVNDPSYSDEQLQDIIDSNNQGFDLDGEHYTNYQGTQLQRNLERRIRELKDTQILAKASDNKKLIAESQEQISLLTDKYRELSQVSGLPTKMERMRVSGYKRVSIKQEQQSASRNIITASHITTPENRTNIMKQGFNLEKSGSQAGNTFGKGIYLTTKQNEIDYYKWRIERGKELKVEVDTTDFMKVKYDDYTSAETRFNPIIEKFKDSEQKQYNQLLKQYKDENKIAEKLSKEERPPSEWKKYWHIDPKQDAVVKILEENYPGLIVETTVPEFDVILGGNQIVVYDLKRIKMKK